MTGIYIHFPFCVKKCFYCDFYSLEQLDKIDSFVDSLCKEISLRLAQYQLKPKVDTIFFGGGTPSLLAPRHLDKIVNTLNTNLTIADNCEITLECNPGTTDIKHLSEYRSIGVNRLSFGVQSFIDEELKFLERIHNSDEAVKAIKTAQDKGFDNISLDLIFALPNQTLEDWDYTLKEAISLQTDHISAYSLIYEQGTPLYKQWKQGQIKKIDDENDAELYLHTMGTLIDAGYEQYEVSNYTKNNKPSLHNLKYWYGDNYIAFGPSAHGKSGNTRYWNYRSLAKYQENLNANMLPTEGSEVLNTEDILFEMIFLQLRAKGMIMRQFEEYFGKEIANGVRDILMKNIPAEFYKMTEETISLTQKGYCRADEISADIMNRLDYQKQFKIIDKINS